MLNRQSAEQRGTQGVVGGAVSFTRLQYIVSLDNCVMILANHDCLIFALVRADLTTYSKRSTACAVMSSCHGDVDASPHATICLACLDPSVCIGRLNLNLVRPSPNPRRVTITEQALAACPIRSLTRKGGGGLT